MNLEKRVTRTHQSRNGVYGQAHRQEVDSYCCAWGRLLRSLSIFPWFDAPHRHRVCNLRLLPHAEPLDIRPVVALLCPRSLVLDVAQSLDVRPVDICDEHKFRRECAGAVGADDLDYPSAFRVEASNWVVRAIMSFSIFSAQIEPPVVTL